MKVLHGLLVAVVLWLAVYAPSFAAAFLLTSDLRLQVVVVIATSLALAWGYLAIAAARHPEGMAAYGLAAAPRRHWLWSLAAGLTFGGLVRLFLVSAAPLPTDGFTPWQIVLLFWIAVPVQEEVIYRGLIQGALATRIDGVVRIGRAKLSPPAVIAAVLFALAHLAAAGLALGLGALVLGLAAGHLRWVSGSLGPAIVVHALFNIVGT